MNSYGTNPWFKSVFVTAVSILLLCGGLSPCQGHPDTVKVGQYRILSLADGLYLNAGPPHADRIQGPNRFSETLRLELGDATTEKWGNFREQRWDLVPAPATASEGQGDAHAHAHGQRVQVQGPYLYWLLSQDNLLNRVSAIKTVGDRTKPNVFDVIPVRAPDGEAFLVRSVLRDACLVKSGIGLTRPVVYAVCNPAARAQHWVLDYLGQ